jgi:trigger factor
VLEELRQSRLQLVPVEGPAEAGHVLQVDLTGVPDRGEPFEREKILLEVGGASQPAAFAANLVGAVPGDERQFEVAYPEGQESGGMAGRTVAYTVRVHEVKRKQIPELDDEFARDLGEEFDDLAALRAKVEGDLLQRKRHEVEGELRQGLLDKVLLANPIVLPEVLVNSELQHRLEQFVRNLILQGVDPEKVQLDWEKLREQQLEPARKSVHARLILDAIGRLESIEVSADEVQQRIRRDAEQMGEKPDKLRKTLEKHSGLQALQNQMLREKALDLLMAVANIQNEE